MAVPQQALPPLPQADPNFPIGAPSEVQQQLQPAIPAQQLPPAPPPQQFQQPGFPQQPMAPGVPFPQQAPMAAPLPPAAPANFPQQVAQPAPPLPAVAAPLPPAAPFQPAPPVQVAPPVAVPQQTTGAGQDVSKLSVRELTPVIAQMTDIAQLQSFLSDNRKTIVTAAQKRIDELQSGVEAPSTAAPVAPAVQSVASSAPTASVQSNGYTFSISGLSLSELNAIAGSLGIS